MSTTTPLTDAINALTTYANETTGASDTDLSSAVATLVAGYGSGGSSTDLADFCANTMTRLDDDNITSIIGNGAQGRTSLTSVFLQNCTEIGNSTFSGCSAITVCVLPSLTTTSSYSFYKMNSLATLDIGGAVTLTGNSINSVSSLTTLILRHTEVCTLSNTSAFTGTVFASGGSGGTIYVPSDLISSYQSATNWSTIDGYGTITWVAIEGSTYETQYADGTAIS